VAVAVPLPDLRPAVPASRSSGPEDLDPPGGPAAEPAPVAAEPADHPAPAPLLIRAARVQARAVARGTDAVRDWSRRPVGRFVVPSLLVLVLVGAAGAAGGAVLPGLYAASELGPTSEAVPGAAAPTGSNESVGIPGSPPLPPSNGPEAAPGSRAEVLRTWAFGMSDRTGIPVVAVQAYGYAELVLERTTPGCQLRWTTLAAIGRVESDHGSSGGATLLANGQALPPIFGHALDGTGDRLLITDTDRGELDGDARYDRAVGPMQFIPRTWQLEAVDASGDGVADVHNINDAALAAGNYLCRQGRDLSDAGDWWQAILAYNNVPSYAVAVYAAADRYGRLSQ
jgi:hypothetical protein